MGQEGGSCPPPPDFGAPFQNFGADPQIGTARSQSQPEFGNGAIFPTSQNSFRNYLTF